MWRNSCHIRDLSRGIISRETVERGILLNKNYYKIAIADMAAMEGYMLSLSKTAY